MMNQVESSAHKDPTLRTGGAYAAPARRIDFWLSSHEEPQRILAGPDADFETLRPSSAGRRPLENAAAPAAKPVVPAGKASTGEPIAGQPVAVLKTPEVPQTIAGGAALSVGKTPKPAPDSPQPEGASRKLEMLKTALVLGQKMLPLLEGNVATALSNLLIPGRSAPASQRDVAALEGAVGHLKSAQRELSEKISEQSSVVQSLSDKLEMVREATDRNTLEQEEMMTDARALKKKVLIFAWVGLALLVASVAMNIVVLFKVIH